MIKSDKAQSDLDLVSRSFSLRLYMREESRCGLEDCFVFLQLAARFRSCTAVKRCIDQQTLEKAQVCMLSSSRISFLVYRTGRWSSAPNEQWEDGPCRWLIRCSGYHSIPVAILVVINAGLADLFRALVRLFFLLLEPGVAMFEGTEIYQQLLDICDKFALAIHALDMMVPAKY